MRKATCRKESKGTRQEDKRGAEAKRRGNAKKVKQQRRGGERKSSLS